MLFPPCSSQPQQQHGFSLVTLLSLQVVIQAISFRQPSLPLLPRSSPLTLITPDPVLENAVKVSGTEEVITLLLMVMSSMPPVLSSIQKIWMIIQMVKMLVIETNLV